jgi:hypothetical protein
MYYDMETGAYECYTCGRAVDYRGVVITKGDDQIEHVRVNSGSGLPEVDDEEEGPLRERLGPRVVPGSGGEN